MFASLRSALSAWYDRNMPAFWLRLKPSFQWALGIAVVAIVWVLSGQLFHTHEVPIEDQGTTSTASAKASDVPRVRVSMLDAQPRDATITVRGRTQAQNSVDARAQVEGVVKAIHYEKGQSVKQGDVLCEIALNDRGAKAVQAKAMVDQTSKELAVAQELFKDGFRSKTQMAAAQANYEQAKAALSTTEIAVANTQIRAPFDGFVDERYVNVGDYMRPGDKCELVIAPEPFLAIGAVSEQQVGEIRVGQQASAKLVTGETVEGKIRFVADRADQTTRTFRVEVELPNPDGKLRDGVSADIHIPIKQIQAIHISPGVLVLDDAGAVGVRAVVNGAVQFYPVQVIDDSPQGMWVAGLPPHLNVITVGQQFVNNGEHVRTEFDKTGGAS